jgi:hypothetical protein
MSEQNQNEQNATPAELSDESMENVAGGVVGETGNSCIPDFPGCILFPPDVITY